jgi:hypothetical protein
MRPQDCPLAAASRRASPAAHALLAASDAAHPFVAARPARLVWRGTGLMAMSACASKRTAPGFCPSSAPGCACPPFFVLCTGPWRRRIFQGSAFSHVDVVTLHWRPLGLWRVRFASVTTTPHERRAMAVLSADSSRVGMRQKPCAAGGLLIAHHGAPRMAAVLTSGCPQ